MTRGKPRECANGGRGATVQLAAYGKHVLVIEYRRADFERGCADYGDTHAIVLRDTDLLPVGRAGHVFESC